MPHRSSIADRAVSGLVVVLAEAVVAVAAIILAFVIAVGVSVLL